MRKQLRVSIGQFSDKGRKALNQDFIGAFTPKEPLLSTKGIAIAIADGISSSNVSQIASETAISGFLSDYFSTSEAWSVKQSAEKVLQATNSWLFAQTQSSPHRYNKDKGYICTFSGLIFKSNAAHIFHSGDTRIYRLVDNHLEQLTEDHRHQVDEGNSYLTRALGVHQQLDMQYRTIPAEEGDTFVLASDGVYEFIAPHLVAEKLREYANDLNAVAQALTQAALDAGSDDNLSIQIVRLEQLPDKKVDEIQQQVETLPLPPRLQARMHFDGYEIEREIYISSRSHVFLAKDEESGEQVVIKTPSTEMRNDTLYLERFLMEDWIAKRIDNAHVMKGTPVTRKRNYLYISTEFIEGQNLAQWMRDNPKPSVEAVRHIVEQIAKGLQAFHRQEMVHQDLRPNNIMIDQYGTVKIIDFGSTKVAGITEIQKTDDIQGTAQFTAPEYFIGQEGKTRSDIFSLGVICYQMLTGGLPYGTAVSMANSASAQNRLNYTPLTHKRKDIPVWVDDAIKKAVAINPIKRYQVLSEFAYDLRHPNPVFVSKTRPPLIERDPITFWKCVSLALAISVVVLLYQLYIP